MDRIALTFNANEEVKTAILANETYICNEVLANSINFDSLDANTGLLADLEEGDTFIKLEKTL